ncbi:MAG: CotH kinase family protein, partial [Defluviitaleaceae bacterium]|nr:CotH kinase family protein [Defluviitaleaceae bacterium]
MYRLLAMLITFLASTNTEYREFPTLYMTSYENPFTVERDYWHTGSIELTGAGSYNFGETEVRLRGRGNSTWYLGWNNAVQKRPLRIRFPETGSFFGSYEHRDWILLANAFDPTGGLRTNFSFEFSRAISNEFVPNTNFINLNVNGQDMGVFQLVDERDIGQGRAELTLSSDPAISEYWLELDFRSSHFNVNGNYYDMREPSGGARTPAHIEYGRNFINAVSEAIRSQAWEDIIALVDMEAMVNFYINQELVKDPDEGMTSTFMTIRGQGEERRLFMGPVWDFDLALGNMGTYALGTENPSGLWAAYRNYWFENLMQIPQFRELVRNRWNEIKENEFTTAILNIVYL